MKLIEKKDFKSLFYLLAVGIFVAFLFVTISGNDGLLKLWKLKKIQNKIRAENHALLQENLSLRQEQKSLHDLKHIEHIARKALGLVYQDEIVYVSFAKSSAKRLPNKSLTNNSTSTSTSAH